MKKVMMALSVMTLVCSVGLARPNGGGPAPRGGGPRPQGGPAQRAPERPRSHDSAWGKGGRNFWPGFVGGLVGSTLTKPVPPPPKPTVVTTQVVTPTVVTTPVVTTPVVTTTPVVVTPTVVTMPTSVQTVWVEGRYVDQVDAAGRVVRVWQPGHYEQVVR